MCIGLHVKHPLFLSYLNFFQQISEKYSNIKFYENPASGSRVVPCRRKEARSLVSQVCESAQRMHPKYVETFFLTI